MIVACEFDYLSSGNSCENLILVLLAGYSEGGPNKRKLLQVESSQLLIYSAE